MAKKKHKRKRARPINLRPMYASWRIEATPDQPSPDYVPPLNTPQT